MPRSPDSERAEHGLRTPEQQRRLQAELLELAHDAVIVRDPVSSRVTFWNREAQAIYGYRRDEAFGRVTHELLRTVFPGSLKAVDEALVRDGLWAGELRHTRRDGREIVVSSRQDLQRDGAGQPLAIIELNSDITVRKRTEGEIRTLNGELEQRVIARTRQLQRLNAELEVAQRLARVGSWSWDQESDEKVWSAQMYALLGRDPRRGPPRRDEYLAYVHPADRDRVAESYARMAQGGPGFELEYRVVDDAGAERRIHALGQQDAEHPGTYRGTVQDVSDLRRSEEQLRRSAVRLERSNRELEEFAYVASHDLQEPLRKIQAFGERVEAACGPALDPRAADYLGRMRGAAGRMSELIAGLLSYSRITTDPLPSAAVDLEAAVADVVADLEPAIEEAGAEVVIGPLPEVPGDAVQLRQLFQNLIANAIKFRCPDAAPRVRVTAARCDAAVVVLEVADNGIGFEERYDERVFRMFERLHGRAEFDGSGIGLAVCRRIVDRHEGTISAHGEPGRGARFTVILPRQAARLEWWQQEERDGERA